jgi:hypothetical protein
MFRRMPVDELPPWFATLEIGDWPLHILNAERGPIGYIDRCLGVYRVHRDSFWSSATGAWRLDQEIRFFKAIDTHLNREFHEITLARVSERYYQLALARTLPGERVRALCDGLKAVWYRPWSGGIRLSALVGLFLTLLYPRLHRQIKRVRVLGTSLSLSRKKSVRIEGDDLLTDLGGEQAEDLVQVTDAPDSKVR